jgi:methyltransferase
VEFLGLASAVAFLLASRVWELIHSARNERLMRLRGGHVARGGAFPLIAALHALFPLALIAEVVGCGTRPGPLWPLWLALWGLGEGLRFAAIHTLGDRWSARIYVVPGEQRVHRGPYRFFAHPNYLGVVLELAALPMLFGAWRTALIAGIANLFLLAIRIRAEVRALAETERAV